jgi:hypothetical protein
MICSSNVFFINNPDPDLDPKLRLKPNTDPQKIISDPQHCSEESKIGLGENCVKFGNVETVCQGGRPRG